LPYALAIYRPGPAGFGFVLQVIKDLLDHYRVFNAGDDSHGAAAAAAGLDVDIENTLEPLRPCHRRSPLCWCCRFISHPDLVAPAPFCRRDQRPVPTVRSEHPVERPEEHTSELQSRENLVCRLLLQKKKPPNVVARRILPTG